MPARRNRPGKHGVRPAMPAFAELGSGTKQDTLDVIVTAVPSSGLADWERELLTGAEQQLLQDELAVPDKYTDRPVIDLHAVDPETSRRNNPNREVNQPIDYFDDHDDVCPRYDD